MASPLESPPAPGSTGPTLPEDSALIALVGAAHFISHFCQLLLPPLFPWLKEAFAVNYTQLGALLTIFFVVSCVVQTLSGFVVDRFGPRPVLLGGLALLGCAALGYATAGSFAMLAAWAVVAGLGNGVFHPVDYTLINHKVNPVRLGHAYSVHGITGSLGWALAPALLVPWALWQGWRSALMAAAAVAFATLALLWWHRDRLDMRPAGSATAAAPGAGAKAELVPEKAAGQGATTFGFLRIPAVWMCFAFFFFYAGALSVVQTHAPQAARELHDVPLK